MIAPANVITLKCRLVAEAAKYFKNKQFFVDNSLEPLKCAWLDMKLAVNGDCLDDELTCTINDLAKKNKQTACSPLDTVTCEDQLPITLTVSDSSACTYTANTYNSTGVSPLAEFSLTNNSDVITATLTSKLTNSCNSEIESNTLTNQITYTDRPKGNVRVMCGGGTYGGALTPDSYPKILRVYETDAFGTLINTPIDLDLDPDTSDYYGPSVPFPDLAVVTPSDLHMGSAYSTQLEAWETLMDNVSIVRYGVPGLHRIRGWATNNGTSFNLGSAPMHNPAGNFFGINRNDVYTKVWTPSGDKTSSGTATYLNGTSVISGSFNYDLLCGAVNHTINSTTITSPVDYSQTSFNKIVLTSNFASQPITQTSNSVSCNNKTLMATYDTANVVSVAWKNPSNATISTSNTVIVGTPGTYTFTATLSNGCQSDKTITI